MFQFPKVAAMDLVKYFFIVSFFIIIYCFVSSDILLRIGQNNPRDMKKGQNSHSEDDLDVQTSILNGQKSTPRTRWNSPTSYKDGSTHVFVPLNNGEPKKLTKVFVPSKGEKAKKRFPQALIIGFAKCGTRALLEYSRLHPYIVTPGPEMHFYDRDEIFRKGYAWYKSKMPLSFSNQLTMEKTPGYVGSFRARTELKKYFPDIKLIALVRNPVDRLVSSYAQTLDYSDHPNTDIRKWLFPGKNSLMESRTSKSKYYTHLLPWYKDFKRSQILVLDGDRLVSDPLSVVQEVETFLQIPKMFSHENFVFNKTKGFFCSKGFEADSKLKCLADGKGRPHPKLQPEDTKLLYSYYRPYNERFYELVNHSYNWSITS